MEKLSIEQKAKLYDEAIEKANEYLSSPRTCFDIEQLRNIFPELKESGDEKIGNEIIAFVEQSIHRGGGTPIPEEQEAKWIAWLEKQGEQKPTLPKWKYKKDNTPLSKDSLILNKYGCVAKSPSGALVSDVWVIDYDELAKLPKEEFEKQGEQKLADKASLDFKKGDILYEQKTMSILLVYERNGSWLMTFCDYWMLKEKLHIEFPYEKYGFVREMSLVPATKEQRDLLFQKMREAGYEFDFEKKRVKKIEQKPAEWSEEDERERKRVVGLLEGWLSTFKETCYAEDCRCGIDWLKSLKERVQPQQEWSEEDEWKINRIYSILRQAADTHAFSTSCRLIGDKECIELQDFLKSLKPQPKQEWSEEDDQYLLVCKNALAKYQASNKWDARIISCWLENKLKAPQNTWKPSDEQMKAVKEAACYSSAFSEKTIENLISLSKQLKKLREE